MNELQEQLEKVALMVMSRKTEISYPLRVMSFSHAKTTVLQYTCAATLKALEANGCIVKHYLTDDAQLAPMLLLEALAEFDPHIVFAINYQVKFLNSSVFNVVWWQDHPVTWPDSQKFRERDISYAVPPLDTTIGVERQDMCVDPDVFHVKPEIARQDRIVVIASAYIEDMTAPNYTKAWNCLDRYLENGQPMTHDRLNTVARICGTTYDETLWYIWPKLVRQKTVEWLCQCSDLIYVDVYGRGWETNPHVAPFYRGEVDHGEALANIYNSAKYSLCGHGFTINSQRLAELSACGTIPVIYDCRQLAEPPYWTEHSLTFRSLATLRACVGKTPMLDSKEIASHATYDKFAKRIIHDVKGKL